MEKRYRNKIIIIIIIITFVRTVKSIVFCHTMLLFHV